MDGDIDDLRELYRVGSHIKKRKMETAISVERYQSQCQAEEFVRYKIWKLLKKAAKNGETSITIYENDNKWFNKIRYPMLVELEKILKQSGFATVLTRFTGRYDPPTQLWVSGWDHK